MGELGKDSRTVAAARRRLLPDEIVLWAAPQPGVGRRGLLVFAAHGLWALAVWGIFTLMGAPGIILVWLGLGSPFLAWWTVEMLSRSFLVTDRRVLFVSAVWPFRWSYWNYSELDEHWVRFGKGRNIIHFRPFSRGTPNWVYNLAVYPDYVENVPDIESVREAILAQIALKPAPVEEPGKIKKNLTVHGTRTG